MSSIARLENNRGDCGNCLLSEWDARKAELYCRIDQEPLRSDHDARTDCPLVEIDHVRCGEWMGKKTHRWISSISMWWHDALECSVCGEAGIKEWKYCPNCGARMEG